MIRSRGMAKDLREQRPYVTQIPTRSATPSNTPWHEIHNASVAACESSYSGHQLLASAENITQAVSHRNAGHGIHDGTRGRAASDEPSQIRAEAGYPLDRILQIRI